MVWTCVFHLFSKIVELKSNFRLDIKQTKFRDNNMFVTKLVSMKLDLNINMILYDYMYTCIKTYLYILEIRLCKFVGLQDMILLFVIY